MTYHKRDANHGQGSAGNEAGLASNHRQLIDSLGGHTPAGGRGLRAGSPVRKSVEPLFSDDCHLSCDFQI